MQCKYVLRFGTLLLDLKYKPEDVILVEKVGSDDYVAVLCNAQFLRDEGIEIPEKGKETKPGRVEDWRGSIKPVSNPRHIKRSTWISHTTLT